LGLPISWKVVEEWIENSQDVIAVEKKVKEPWKKKNPDIPILSNYQVPPKEHFCRDGQVTFKK
jgi:hypothetical protein